ncbi:MAG TPA: hypothetical protein VHB20_19265 [Verrucomicrobiae bacterium]|jgi:hypothetical protein|nr:hypothetical protein [Verrucomicrobiae bacterium]
MNLLFRPSLRLLAVCLLAVPAARAQIRTYTVPKEPPPSAAPVSPTAPTPAPMANMADPMSGGQVPLPDASSRAVRWQTPPGWQELAPSSFRIGSFAIADPSGKKAEVAVTSFPGSVGSELSNVNRWRGELSLPPVEENAIASEPVTVDGVEGKLYDFSGGSARTIVADIPRLGISWFFKLRGDKEVVTSTRPAFLEFLRSVKFGGAPAAPAAAASMPAPETSAAGDAPRWNPPASWREQTAGPMVLKSYTAGADGAATVSISSFPGDVGGTLANVNRWRGQLGLAPITQADLPTAAKSINAGGGQGTLVDFTGVFAKTGKPARMVAAIVPVNGQMWFYKLVGDETAVGGEKDNFVKFVEGVQYH